MLTIFSPVRVCLALFIVLNLASFSKQQDREEVDGGCTCVRLECSCCTHMEIKAFQLNDNVCLNVTLSPIDKQLSIDFDIDQKTVFSEKVSSLDDKRPELCFDVPNSKTSLCLDINNKVASDDSFSGCASLKMKSTKPNLKEMRIKMGCFQLSKNSAYTEEKTFTVSGDSQWRPLSSLFGNSGLRFNSQPFQMGSSFPMMNMDMFNGPFSFQAMNIPSFQQMNQNPFQASPFQDFPPMGRNQFPFDDQFFGRNHFENNFMSPYSDVSFSGYPSPLMDLILNSQPLMSSDYGMMSNPWTNFDSYPMMNMNSMNDFTNLPSQNRLMNRIRNGGRSQGIFNSLPPRQRETVPEAVAPWTAADDIDFLEHQKKMIDAPPHIKKKLMELTKDMDEEDLE